MNVDPRLLEAIVGAPLEDGPRLALAQWLQREGDAWGDFIEAQLRGDDEAALAHLDAARAATRLPLLGVPGLRAFRRGFLAEVLTSGERALPSADEVTWALVDHLRLANPRAADFITAVGTRLSALHSFETDTGDAARALSVVRPLPLRQLKVHALDDWFDLTPLVDVSTSLTLSVVGVLEMGRDPGRVTLSPPAHPFHGQHLAAWLRAVVRADDAVEFIFMGSREPVEATRRALESIPHRSFTEHALGLVAPG